MSNPKLVYDFDENGFPIFKSKQEIDEPLSSKLNKLFREGEYLKLTEDGLETAPTNSAMDLDEDASQMTEDQVRKLKESMVIQLQTANNELIKALELLNYLTPLPTDAPSPNLPMGHGSMGISVLSTPLPYPTPEATAYDMSLALAIKSQSLSKAASTLSQAADKFKSTNAKSQNDWKTYNDWADQGWTLISRGAQKGASIQPGTSGTDLVAKEIVAVLACAEAPFQVKLNNVAYISDESKVAVTERIHGRRRLRVAIKMNSEGENEAYTTVFDTEDLLQQTRIELFEEELFSEAVKEANLQQKSDDRPFKCQIAQDSLRILFADSFELHLSMIPITESIQNNGSYAQLASAVLRMRLLAIYRWRREQVTGQGSAAKQPLIVRPIVDLFSYYIHVKFMRQHLSSLIAELAESGVKATLDFRPVDQDAASILEQIESTSTLKIGGSATITITDEMPLRLVMSAPTHAAIDLPHARVPLYSRQQAREILTAETERIKRAAQVRIPSKHVKMEL